MIVSVDAADDPRLDAYRYVGDHGWLRARGLFVAEGRLVVERLIAAPVFRIESALVTPAALAALETALRAIEAPIFVASQPLLNAIAGFNFHRGCLALARRPVPAGPESVHGARLLLGLERIGNPDNVGGLFRTAAAFGVDAVLLDRETGDPMYRKALRTSMGAVLGLPFVHVADWAGTMADLRARGFTIVALTPDPSAAPLDDFASSLDDAVRLVLMVGAEGSGLGAAVRSTADALVRIPMRRGVDSLNVAVAAGVALSRVVRAR